MLFFLLLCAIWNVLSIADQYPTPFRSWLAGVFTGNPAYSPVGPFTNYTIILRKNDGTNYPPEFVMVETGTHSFDTTHIGGTYQQWTLYGTQISYCGLLTFTHGLHYITTHPQFVYRPDLSSENELYFCGDPRGGGCDTLWWQWRYNSNTRGLQWNTTLSGEPHEFIEFVFMNEDSNLFPVQTELRSMCVSQLGNENPYNYDWVADNSSNINYERFNHHNRQEFKKNIPDYQKHYKHRKTYN